MRIQDDPDFRYIYHERLGHLCEDRAPTPEQRAIAFAEAKQYVKERISETTNHIATKTQ